MENPIKKDDLGVPPFKETPTSFLIFVSFFLTGELNSLPNCQTER